MYLFMADLVNPLIFEKINFTDPLKGVVMSDLIKALEALKMLQIDTG
jgi:hypothetical protein